MARRGNLDFGSTSRVINSPVAIADSQAATFDQGFDRWRDHNWVSVAINALAPTTINLVANRYTAAPFLVSTTITIVGAELEVTTGSAATSLRSGIYADNGSGYPGALVANTELLFSTAVAAVQYKDFAYAVTLTPGIYWSTTWSGGTATVRAVPVGAVAPVLGDVPTGGANGGYTVWNKTGETYTGNIASNFPAAATLANLNVPKLNYRVNAYNPGASFWPVGTGSYYTDYSGYRSTNYGTLSQTVSTPTGTWTASDYGATCVMADGRVFLVPFNNGVATAKIYDPVANTLTSAGGSWPVDTFAVGGAVLLPDGRVFCTPLSSTTARIYDPFTNTLSTPAGTWPATGAPFVGAVLLSDGRVFAVPADSTSARIYDPVSNTLITPAGTYPGLYAYEGGVLLSDERVLLIPSGAANPRIYDPNADTLTTSATSFSGFAGGVLMTDGRVYCIPYSGTTARIYNPTNDTVTTPAGTFPGSGGHAGGLLMPDGKIFICPCNSSTARIYDPVGNTLTTPSGTFPTGTDIFYGGHLLKDGRIYMNPLTGSSSRIYGAALGSSLPNSRFLSAYDNKF